MIFKALHTFKTHHFFTIPALAILLLAVGRDIHFSVTNQSSFYISESLLFNTFWLLFIPVAFFRNTLIQKLPFQIEVVNTVLLTIFHLLVFSMVVFSVSALFMYHTFDFVWVFSESLSDHWFTCVLIYGLLQFLDLKKKPKAEPEIQLRRIRVNHLNQNILLSTTEIQYIKTERPYIALVTQDHTYLHSQTLNGFLSTNPAGNFIQVHKSTVINTDYIHAYVSRKNGDYDITMKNAAVVRASRNYNKHFKTFIQSQDSQ